MNAANVISWPHLGTDRMLPETLDSATSPAVPLITARRRVTPPAAPTRLGVPSPEELARFTALLKTGTNGCRIHPHTRVTISGVIHPVRHIAWYLAEGVWPDVALTHLCGMDRCCTRAHLQAVRQEEGPRGMALPTDEVAKFLGISDAALRVLCRRVLQGKPITPRGLDALVEAQTALGGKLP